MRILATATVLIAASVVFASPGDERITARPGEDGRRVLPAPTERRAAAQAPARGRPPRRLQALRPAELAAQEVVDRLVFARFRSNIQQLAGFGTRYWRSQGNRQARGWIQAQLESFGYVVERHPIRIPAPLDQLLPTGEDSLYVTKVGTLHPDRMYIVSAHMDSINRDSPEHTFAPGADDDGSGTALVLELARVFAALDIRTDISVRFIFWNAEEIGLVGSRAYVRDRRPLQGTEDPPGSGRFPEPRWLGVIQHDMLLFDHGLPDPVTGRVAGNQIPGADVDIEYDVANTAGGGAIALANALLAANSRYATRYPAEVGQLMCCTDSVPFAPFVPAVSVRENERRAEIGRGANPHWHRNSDVFATYREEDFRLGFAAAQMTAGAIAELAGARLVGR